MDKLARLPSRKQIRLISHDLSPNGPNRNVCRPAKCREPGSFSLFELTKYPTLQVNERCYPFVLFLGAIVRSRKYCDLCPFDFDTMHVLHFVISGYEHPAVFVAKPNNFRVFYVSANVAVRIHKPLGKSLDCKTRRPEANGD